MECLSNVEWTSTLQATCTDKRRLIIHFVCRLSQLGCSELLQDFGSNDDNDNIKKGSFRFLFSLVNSHLTAVQSDSSITLKWQQGNTRNTLYTVQSHGGEGQLSYKFLSFNFHLGFVDQLQDVALHHCLSLSFCLLLSCSRWFPPSLLCRLAIVYLVVPLISSFSS